jgi:hypothetical protein
MDKFQLIYDGEYVFCVNVYYKDRPECKIKVCYVATPLKDCILLEEVTSMYSVKYITHNLEKTITLDNNGMFNLEDLKNYTILRYNHKMTSDYDFNINATRIAITHTFTVVPIATIPDAAAATSNAVDFKVSYKFLTYQHVKN